ncbi:transposase IS4 family protein [Thermoanaerobacter italicus Ab9]|uniref:Transposase IS4 family protein n=1 Tax=Thermoanaerobacter italicus (strain DSM 9252 / Ab9) TaxID=580331 RepID=D3T4H9_THEIA|nr:IS1182 family transposase [Thermoanaerobacter italicus]ADD03131.1 transposase IS4 family protein [Thermoanaerobacter italicus Ab9]
MYIRQQSFFSFEEILKFQPETRLEKIFSALDYSNVLTLLPKQKELGRKGYSKEAMFLAIIAMRIENIKTIAALVKRLKTDPVFRFNCGFNVLGSIPSESTFSRFLTLLSESEVFQKIFETLVLKAKALGIIDGANVAIDSSEYESYDKAIPKSKIQDNGQNPNWGSKKDTNGNQIKWFGYKLHIAVDTESELPLAIEVTPANVYDSTMAIPLMESIKNIYGDTFTIKNYLMDKGYDVKEIYRKVYKELKAQAIIPINPRGSYAPPEGLDENAVPVCSMGYSMVYWGYDGIHHKFRCPHVTGKVDCPYGSYWCSTSSYGLVVKQKIDDDPRLFTFPHRCTHKWKKLYDKRTSVERCFSRLKEHLGLKNLMLKGIKKAKLHAYLCCIGLIAGTIAVNLSSIECKAA